MKLMFIFCIFTNAAIAVCQPVALPKIKLATWNLMWLDANIKSGKVKRTKEDYQALQRYAQKLNADVIAVQEVESVNALKRVFAPEIYNFEVSGRVSNQRTGFVIKKGLQYKRNPDCTSLSIGNPRLRRGVDISLKVGNQNIRMLSVHLKAGCFEGNLARSKTCKKLTTQLSILEDWMDDRYRDGTPFVVLGDFNRRINTTDAFWMELNDNEPKGLSLKTATMGENPQCQEGEYNTFIDHIITGPQITKLISGGSFKELVYAQSHTTSFKLSDHCPISISLEVPGDRSP
jgi:endonuclease/exonuclease/phosphatase family metal-dependent hydrolase